VKESVIVTAVIMYLIAVSSAWLIVTTERAHDAAQFTAANVHSPVLGPSSSISCSVVGTSSKPFRLLSVTHPASSGQRPGIDPVHFG
jgi:hypothetical protein